MSSNWKDYLQTILKFRKKEWFRIETESISKHDLYLQIQDFSMRVQHQIGKARVPISLLGLSDISLLIAFLGTLQNGQIPFLMDPKSTHPSLFPNFVRPFTDPNTVPVSSLSQNLNPVIQSKELSLHSGSDFFIQTSGSQGSPKWIGLQFENLMHSLSLHKERIEGNNCTTLSVLPYHHIFGLVLDVLLSLEFDNNVVRLKNPELNFESLCSVLNREEKIYLCGVPKFFETIIETGNLRLLKNCRAGIVGGARISVGLADALRDSKFQVGYGQTEACPGILLGEKGEFFEAYLGKEIGVSVKLSDLGTLAFQGKNAFREIFSEAHVLQMDADRWVDTGDLVEKRGERYFYTGRLGFRFKLSNGKWMDPEEVEEEMKTHTSGLPLFFLAEHPGGGIQIYVPAGDRARFELLKKSLPSFLQSEKIWLQPLEEWSKDRKGNPNRNAMQTMKSKIPGTFL